MRALLKSKEISGVDTRIAVTGSKSESNRLLLLKALFSNITIDNLSKSDDTVVLKQALETSSHTVDIHHAGTAMRFLTAYFASTEGVDLILSGSQRMHERPIKILVDALKDLGANIEYIDVDGYPPLRICGAKLKGDYVKMKANVSSQFISALLLIAPSLPKGLTLELEGAITSRPYINMTLALLNQIDVTTLFEQNTIHISPKEVVKNTSFVVESDWSSASYFYSLIALSNDSKVTLTSYSGESLQGDAALCNIYKELGVDTVFNASERAITLSKRGGKISSFLSLNLSNTPDIAQTIAVTCFGLGIGCKLTGLHTLKIKETDRLSALKTELEKLGATISITNDSLELEINSNAAFSEANSSVCEIDTYQDHRMAMAFAPLALKFPLIINDPMVVTKSFPSFWEDAETMGIAVDFK
jgi:3-phosphoshikimate 1-carboxyvinyltransferase